jgi:farnesyl-diphosphate farnesyltransferase
MKGDAMNQIGDLLQKTSRTFALTIPFLPEPTRAEVSIGYLLFRIIDTFEDATRWPPERRIDALARFVALVDGPPESGASMAQECLRDPPVDNPAYLELLGEIPLVLRTFSDLQRGARASIRTHLARSAEGMSRFVARSGGPHGLELETLQDLQDYCYAVAGIVGEMLTELFLLGRPTLAVVGEDLRSRAAQFGEGLQLVNILKDARPDAAEGRVFLPRSVNTREVFALASRDLAAAAAYTEALRAGGAEAALVAFNAFIAKLAVANLRLLRERGLGAKLTRLQVATISAEVARAVGRHEPLFAEMQRPPAA